MEHVFSARATELLPLTWNDFVAVHVNWNRKCENVALMAEQLNIALDVIVFVDDNPREVEEMRAALPQVVSLLFSPSCRLERLFFTDVARTTAEDRERTRNYQSESKRLTAAQEAPSFGDFLAALQLQVEMVALEEGTARRERAQQLMLRTNQFNVNPAHSALAPDVTYWLVAVRDKFGDYGESGLVGVQWRDGGAALHVVALLLSCRVLARGVEQRVVRFLAQLANERGLDCFTVHWARTARNEPALAALHSLAHATDEKRGTCLVHCVSAHTWEAPIARSHVSTSSLRHSINPRLYEALVDEGAFEALLHRALLVDESLLHASALDSAQFVERLTHLCQRFCLERFGVHVGATQSFSELSFGSTHVLALVQHMNRSLRLHVSPAMFFAATSLHDLAAYVAPSTRSSALRKSTAASTDFAVPPSWLFHHTGVAVVNVEEARDFLLRSGWCADASAVVYDPQQDATLCMVTDRDRMHRVELVGGAAVASLLASAAHTGLGTGVPYHICFEVTDIARALHYAQSELGCTLVREIRPAVLFGGRSVCFVSSPVGLVELLQGCDDENSRQVDSMALSASSSFSSARGRLPLVRVVGAACRVDVCTSPTDLWRLVLQPSRDCVRLIPPHRALRAQCTDVEAASWHGCFIDALDSFDAAFFSISPREASAMDPQQRMLLECAWEAASAANVGTLLEELPPEACMDVGVFVGVNRDDYAHALLAREKLVPFGGTGTDPSMAAGRVSYVFGWLGPCIALATACSSALVAVASGLDALAARTCQAASCSGVNIAESPVYWRSFFAIGALARDGRCKSFDAAGDGYGRAEGCNSVMLSTQGLPHAQAAIVSHVVNHDGRSNGLTAPNGAAQALMWKRSLAMAAAALGRPCVDLGGFEAHGTGTKLGDPTELIGLDTGAGLTTLRARLLSSIKTQLGHAEPAAGLFGVLRVALSMEAGWSPRTNHFSTINEFIGVEMMERMRLVLPLEAVAGMPPLVSVSAFGFAGTNANVIIAHDPAGGGAAAQAFPVAHAHLLSAKTQRSLEQLVGLVEVRRVRGLDAPTWPLFDGPRWRRTGVVASVVWPRLMAVERRAVAGAKLFLYCSRRWRLAPQAERDWGLVAGALPLHRAGCTTDAGAVALADAVHRWLLSSGIAIAGAMGWTAACRALGWPEPLSADAAYGAVVVETGRTCARARGSALWMHATGHRRARLWITQAELRAQLFVPSLCSPSQPMVNVAPAAYPFDRRSFWFLASGEVAPLTYTSYCVEWKSASVAQHVVDGGSGGRVVLMGGSIVHRRRLRASLGALSSATAAVCWALLLGTECRNVASLVQFVRLVQRVLHHRRFSKLVLLTRSAVCVQGISDAPPQPLQAALWGLGRSVREQQQQQCSSLSCVSIDVDEFEALSASAWLTDAACERVYRGGVCFAPVLSENATGVAPFNVDVSVSRFLLSGGFSNLAPRCCSWIRHRFVTSAILLVGRSGAAERHEDVVANVDASLAEGLVCARADLSERGPTRALLQLAHVEGLVHLAAMEPAPALSTASAWCGNLKTKTKLLALMQRWRHHIPFAVLFSSSACLKPEAQGGPSYAAANLAMETFAITNAGWTAVRLSHLSDGSRSVDLDVDDAHVLDADHLPELLDHARNVTRPVVCLSKTELTCAFTETLEAEAHPLWSVRLPLRASLRDVHELVVIVGAGMQALAAARLLQKRGVPFVLLDRQHRVGGVWAQHANAHSMAQTESATYHLDVELDAAHEHVSNYTPRDELLAYFDRFVRKHHLQQHILLACEVERVRAGPLGAVEVSYTTSQGDGRRMRVRASQVFLFPGRLAVPVEVHFAGEADFGAPVVSGYGDALTPALCPRDGHVVVVGHGAFALETVRFALDHGAARVTLLCRKRHPVLPRVASWLVNASVAPLDAATLLGVMSVAYDVCGSTPVAFASQAGLTPISDLYFLAQLAGRLVVVEDEIERLDSGGHIVCRHGALVPPAQLLVKCTGFAPDAAVDRLVGLTSLDGLWVNGDSRVFLYREGRGAQGTANMDSTTAMVLLDRALAAAVYFMSHRDEFLALAPMLPSVETAVDFGALHLGLTFAVLQARVPELKAAFARVMEVKQRATLATHPLAAFLAECSADWAENARRLGLAHVPPYPFTQTTLQWHLTRVREQQDAQPRVVLHVGADAIDRGVDAFVRAQVGTHRCCQVGESDHVACAIFVLGTVGELHQFAENTRPAPLVIVARDGAVGARLWGVGRFYRGGAHQRRVMLVRVAFDAPPAQLEQALSVTIHDALVGGKAAQEEWVWRAQGGPVSWSLRASDAADGVAADATLLIDAPSSVLGSLAAARAGDAPLAVVSAKHQTTILQPLLELCSAPVLVMASAHTHSVVAQALGVPGPYGGVAFVARGAHVVTASLMGVRHVVLVDAANTVFQSAARHEQHAFLEAFAVRRGMSATTLAHGSLSNEAVLGHLASTAAAGQVWHVTLSSHQDRVLPTPPTQRLGLVVGASAASSHRQPVSSVDVKSVIAHVLQFDGSPEDALDADASLMDLGLDSLLSVELAAQLSEHSGLRVPVSVAYSHPSVTQMQRYMDERLEQERQQQRQLQQQQQQQAPQLQSRPRRAASVTVPAECVMQIQGVSCRFGSAWSALQLCDALCSGRDWVISAPVTRAHDAPPRGGFFVGLECFDAAFFGMTPREGRATEPPERLLLECSWEVVENAGRNPTALRDHVVGAYVGCVSGGASWQFARVLELTGECVSIDTACSSALVALSHGCRALQCASQAEAQTASLCFGVHCLRSAMLAPFAPDLSASGRCKTFDASADGYVRGEGCGAFFVARGSAGVGWHATLLGHAVSHGPDWARVVRQVAAQHGCGPAHYVEAHGTGCRVDDAREVSALVDAWGASPVPRVLGASKTTLGHCEGAAGALGVLRALVECAASTVGPNVHFSTLSPLIGSTALETDMVSVIALEAIHWAAPPRAAINSFGRTGTNAHLVLGLAGVVGETRRPVARTLAQPPENLRAWVEALEHGRVAGVLRHQLHGPLQLVTMQPLFLPNHAFARQPLDGSVARRRRRDRKSM